MSYLLYLAYFKYFIHYFVIMNESWINCLPITNPGTADSKPLGGFMLG